MLLGLFDAERTARKLHDELLRGDRDAVLSAIGAQVKAALAERQEAEGGLRLFRLSALLGEFTGPKAVDLLIDVLGSEIPEARFAAGEALSDLSFDRFKDVALGVERALERLPDNSPARAEIPFILLEVPEPGVSKLLEKMLAQKDPEAVSAAIEACAELRDPALARALEPLRADPRVVELEDDEGEVEQTTVGQLAIDALEMLAEPG